MNTKILITGGTGFIGTNLCRKLLEKGAKLTVLSRNPGRVTSLFGDSARGIKSLDELQNEEAFDSVINLAGAPIADKRWTEDRKALLRDSRIGLTSRLVDFLARLDKKPACLISASAVGYYGDQGETEVDEETPPHDEFTHRLCRDWEAEALRAREFGVRVCLLRIGLVVGKGGGFLKKMLPPFKFGLGGRLGSGQQWMSWVHRDDLVGLIFLLLENENLSGPFNGTSPKPVRNSEFTKTLARVLNRPAFFPLPAFFLQFGFGDMSRLLLTGQKALPAAAARSGFEFKYVDLEDALRDVLS